MSIWRRAWIGLGGNVGDVTRAFDRAVESLRGVEGVRVRVCSRHYRTPAWGKTDQADFSNAVLAIDTRLRPEALLTILLAIERAHGRDRARELHWGPRTLDLDLLAIEGETLDSPNLRLPHPRLAERSFVLVPWAEIDPDIDIPGLGRVAALRDALDCSGIEAIP